MTFEFMGLRGAMERGAEPVAATGAVGGRIFTTFRVIGSRILCCTFDGAQRARAGAASLLRLP